MTNLIELCHMIELQNSINVRVLPRTISSNISEEIQDYFFKCPWMRKQDLLLVKLPRTIATYTVRILLCKMFEYGA